MYQIPAPDARPRRNTSVYECMEASGKGRGGRELLVELAPSQEVVVAFWAASSLWAKKNTLRDCGISG